MQEKKRDKSSINVIIIGAGHMGELRGKHFKAEDAEIVCVVSKSGKSAEKLAKRFDADVYGSISESSQGEITVDFHNIANDQLNDEFLRDTRIDAALIEVPHVAQTACIKWAIRQNIKYILLGAPLATSTVEAEQLLLLAQKNGSVIETGFEKRYSPLHKEALKFLPQLGHVNYIMSVMEFPADLRSWYGSQKESGGTAPTHGIYQYSLIREFLKEPPVSITAVGRKAFSRPDSVLESYEAFIRHKTSDSEAVINLAASYKPSSLKLQRFSYIVGDKGKLYISHNTDEPGGKLHFYPVDPAVPETTITFNKDAPDRQDPFSEQIRAFIYAVKTGDSSGLRCSAEDAIIDVRVAEATELAVARSLAGEQPYVELPVTPSKQKLDHSIAPFIAKRGFLSGRVPVESEPAAAPAPLRSAL